MQETLGLTDVLDVLIQLETLGHDHYARMERDADNPDLKRLFGILSVQELRHKALYVEWKGVFSPHDDQPPTAEYLDYARALLTETISFLNGAVVASDFTTGYNAAVQLEKDTLLLLSELKTFLPSVHHNKVDRVMDQERQHLAHLAAFRR